MQKQGRAQVGEVGKKTIGHFPFVICDFPFLRLLGAIS
jgi:hypothetical protein